MSWFSNLFSSGSNSRTSGRKVMTSTHEAFSLPTSSPSMHPDAFNGAEIATARYGTPSSSYSYPPSSPSGPYYDVPSTARTPGTAPILPVHAASGASAYPPLSHTWSRLRQWLTREYPELHDTLNYGILPLDLSQIEMAFGFALPQPVRESYLCCDGQEPESSAGCAEGLFFGLTLLPLEDVLEEWRFWREVDDDAATGANQALRDVMQSVPPGWVRKEYSCRGWIPLVADRAGNYLGIDLNPGEGGAVGQVIVFGRDFDTKVVMWRGDGPAGWAKWLAGFVEDLESGEGYELGNADGSEDSEDGLGYSGYFFDGVGGGQGDTGGDAGTGGLRIGGEYRGWNVLEAWADRSLRRWVDAGVMSDPAEQVVEKSKMKPTLAPIEVGISTAGAEVPIPLIADVTGESQKTAVAPDTAMSNATMRPNLPTISITKPPAPLPIDLPSPSEIEEEDASFPPQDDVEGQPAREAIPREPTPTQPTKPSVSAPPMASPTPSLVPSLSESPKLADLATPPSSVPNLLIDATVESVGNRKSEEDSPVMVDSPDRHTPDNTVRLVGGGGLSGAVEDLQTEGVLVDEEPEAVVDVPLTDQPNDLATPTSAGPNKKRFSANLKKLGQIGGKRRTDSVSSNTSAKQ